jgi:SPP1 gp7 family putative phage head morphogenesis protein
MPDTALIDLAMQYRAAVLKRDAAAMLRLVNAYGGMYQTILKDVDRLILKIEAAKVPMTKGQIQRLGQYKDLLDAVEAQVNQFGGYLRTEMTTEARALIAQAGNDAKRLIATALGTNDAKVLAMIKMLNPAVTETLLGFLDPKGTLFSYWNQAGADVAKRIAQTIVDSVGMGKNPKVLARLIQGDLGNNLTSALRTARTTQLWAYREASRANYVANQDVIKKWQWVANLDGLTCGACVALHGTIYDTDTPMEGHWNCRCTLVPVTILNPNPDRQKGEDWFKEQPEATQKSILGPGKYDAWKAGQFEFSRLAQHSDDVVFSKMWTETPLKDLVTAE